MEGDAGAGQLNPADQAHAETPAEAPEAATADSTVVVDGGAAVAAASPTGAVAPGARATRLDGRGWLRIAAVLALLALALAGGGYLNMRASQHNRAMARADLLAVEAAEDCVAATQAPDGASVHAAQQKIRECATGAFAAQADLYAGAITQAYNAAQVQVQVSEMRTAIERNNADGSVDLLMAMRVRIAHAPGSGQEFGYRLRVQMAEEDGRYKIARLDQVSK